MKESFTLASPDLDVTLRTIKASDGERLRKWKNANRRAFFFQGIIASDQQRQWFQGYLERPNDHMFVVLSMGRAVGCMGFRLLDHQADIYNVIMGNREMAGKGIMTKAMRIMCSFIAADFSQDIRAKVLKLNPAVEWYRKNGFREVAMGETFVEVKLELERFRPCRLQKVQSHQSSLSDERSKS